MAAVLACGVGAKLSHAPAAHVLKAASRHATAARRERTSSRTATASTATGPRSG